MIRITSDDSHDDSDVNVRYAFCRTCTGLEVPFPARFQHDFEEEWNQVSES